MQILIENYTALLKWAAIFWIYILTHSIFHEIGHAIRVRKYKSHNMLVLFKWFNKKPIYFKIKNTIFALGEIKKIPAKTFVEKNFTDFDIEQIKYIAYGGYFGEITYGIVLSILYIFSINNNLILKYILVLIFMIMVLLSSYVVHVKRAREWSDGNIIRNTEKFVECMRNLKETDEMDYQNAIKKYVNKV